MTKRYINPQFVSREVPKKDLQGILKAMRKHPAMTVEKTTGGYTVTDTNGILALQAMVGNYAYLVRLTLTSIRLVLSDRLELHLGLSNNASINNK